MPAIWESSSPGARVARAALAPASLAYGAAVALRNALYDGKLLQDRELGIPTISVGNVAVGGTGKTPVAAWLANELAARGASPAILLRGYGGDETQVHVRLAPSAVVVANADRVAGARAARAKGVTVAVLDDAFQHRRVRRDADVVLLSADQQWATRLLLPAGPWREPMAALRRADLVLVTRKAASAEKAHALAAKVLEVAPNTACGIVSIEADSLVRWDGSGSLPLPADVELGAVSAIGNPAAFDAQLTAAGIRARGRRFPDHYRFSEADAAAIASRAPESGVVCTLKDAVKLGPRWPSGAPPLWYLSQRVVVERGADRIAETLSRLLRAAGGNADHGARH